jgi:hypothetical protein
VIDHVKSGMAERDLLESSEPKRLKVFTVIEYSLPERTRTLLPHQSAKMVATLLERCQTSRPEVWKLLEKQVKSAISRRTESADYD